mmetsp:Transcript_30956/g.77004  ORF Transcript_30956/g.77004 Transcript_30956/m.77004 type:complete len:357 (+) Transcript_30956:120-1190(+)
MDTSTYAPATRVLRDEMWIGPTRSTALDANQKVWYIGGAVVDDRKVFVRDLLLTPGESVQWVYDLGDWWSHTVTVVEEGTGTRPEDGTRTPEDAAADAALAAEVGAGGVAQIISGAGACPPDDSGGLMGYVTKVMELLGLNPMTDGATGDRHDDDYDSEAEGGLDNVRNLEKDPTGMRKAMDGSKSVDPAKRAFWRHLNDNFRGQKNWMEQGDGMSVGFNFNLDKAQRRLAEALRAGRVSGQEAKRGFIVQKNTGSGFECSGANKEDKAVSDFEKCAVCGVTAGIKACARCNAVKYCCREHQSQDWPEHRVVCKQLAEEAEAAAKAGKAAGKSSEGSSGGSGSSSRSKSARGGKKK